MIRSWIDFFSGDDDGESVGGIHYRETTTSLHSDGDVVIHSLNPSKFSPRFLYRDGLKCRPAVSLSKSQAEISRNLGGTI